MAFTKIYNGAGSGATAGNYADSRNWELISLRNSRYAWTQVGATAEYYVRTSANANPGFAASPPASNGVYINGSAATQGTLTSLSAGQWAYGDPATLGYNTIVVRITGDGDPDAQAIDYVQFRQIPQAAEFVRVPAGAGNISSGLDQSAVAIERIVFEEGYDGDVGTSSSYFKVDPNSLEDHSRGTFYVDIGAANITLVINNQASAAEGEFAFNLIGTNIATIDYRNGTLGIAPKGDISSTFADLILAPGASGLVKIGALVGCGDIVQHGGRVWCHGDNPDTVKMYAGEFWLMEASEIDTELILKGGEFYWAGSGNILEVDLYGGVFDEQASNATRTLTTLNKYMGRWTLKRNKEAVTHTTVTDQDSYTQIGAFSG